MLRIIDKIGDKFSEFKDLITQIFLRFPIAGALALLNIIFSNALVYRSFGEEKIGGACLLASMMSIGLSVMFGLFYEAGFVKRGVAYGLQALSFVFFIAAACAFYEWVDYNEVFVYPYALTFGAIAALSLFALSSSREEPRDVVPMAAFSVMTAGVATLVFALGVSLVFIATKELLELEISRKAYQTLWLSSVSSLFVTFALAYGTKKERFNSPKIWKVLVGYVAFPVYLLLTLVMLVFCLKCAAKWSLPNGEVNLLVIVSSALWMAFRYLTAVYDGKVFRLFNRFGSLLILPQILLQGIALWIRIDNYGLTPERYLSVVFAIFMAIVAIGVFFGSRFSGRVVFLIFAAFALTISYGPLNVVDFTVKSQIAKYEEFKARKIAGEKFDEATQNVIMGTWEYIGSYEKSSWRYIPKKDKKFSEEDLKQFEKEWGFKFVDKYSRRHSGQCSSKNKWYSYSRQSGDLKLDGLKVIGYRRFNNIHTISTIKDDLRRVEYKVELEGLKCNVDLNEMILKAFANDANPKDLRFDLGDGRIAVVLKIHCSCDESQIITYINGTALICETNWYMELFSK
ncbi:MAG: DUF4153 domain-containing protein [Kiritimatiellae bacterium]|nr:DUF4153 domain-containing protein [Kiritimatiellia bacterium]